MIENRSAIGPRLIAVVSALAAAATIFVAGPAVADPVEPIESPSSTPTPTAPVTPPKPVKPCATRIPKVVDAYWKKVPKSTRQVIVVEGNGMKSYNSRVVRWEKIRGCWIKLSTYSSFNGYKGWAVVPWTGGRRSPIGTYRLTDAGGRRRNPGTKMPYDYSPAGYRYGNSRNQIFDYVVAVNYNRFQGAPPKSTHVPNPHKASGYWFHVRRAFPTKGCVSLAKKNMKTLVRWLDPAKKPVTIQGPKSVIYDQIS